MKDNCAAFLSSWSSATNKFEKWTGMKSLLYHFSRNHTTVSQTDRISWFFKQKYIHFISKIIVCSWSTYFYAHIVHLTIVNVRSKFFLFGKKAETYGNLKLSSFFHSNVILVILVFDVFVGHTHSSCWIRKSLYVYIVRCLVQGKLTNQDTKY